MICICVMPHCLRQLLLLKVVWMCRKFASKNSVFLFLFFFLLFWSVVTWCFTLGQPLRLYQDGVLISLQCLLSTFQTVFLNVLLTGGEDGERIRAETWKAIVDETLSGEEDESSAAYPTPAGNRQGPHPHPTNLKPSTIVPHPSLSDTGFRPTPSRRPPFLRYISQMSDSDGRESRVSLPEISSSPLINTPQGGSTGVPNNDPLQYYNGRSGVQTTSLDSMVRNDLSMDTTLQGRVAANGHRMVGTPLLIEEVGDQKTPTPHPPPASDRSTSRRSGLSRSDTLETDSKS